MCGYASKARWNDHVSCLPPTVRNGTWPNLRSALWDQPQFPAFLRPPEIIITLVLGFVFILPLLSLNVFSPHTYLYFQAIDCFIFRVSESCVNCVLRIAFWSTLSSWRSSIQQRAAAAYFSTVVRCAVMEIRTCTSVSLLWTSGSLAWVTLLQVLRYILPVAHVPEFLKVRAWRQNWCAIEYAQISHDYARNFPKWPANSPASSVFRYFLLFHNLTKVYFKNLCLADLFV